MGEVKFVICYFIASTDLRLQVI